MEHNRSVRAVILAAAGTAFCAGHDLREMRNRTPDEYRHLFTLWTKLMTKVQSIPQPVIAEVQGVATAAGCQLVASCDLAVASEGASFATPGVRIGLFCTMPMVALSRAIGRKRALQMLLTGESIDAGTAAHWGLINCVVPEAELRAMTRKFDTAGEFGYAARGCMSLTNRDCRVWAGSSPASHWLMRTRLIAVAIKTCCRCVLA
jgi:enoyl-CoA hydratase/carnithine racemase